MSFTLSLDVYGLALNATFLAINLHLKNTIVIKKAPRINKEACFTQINANQPVLSGRIAAEQKKHLFI